MSTAFRYFVLLADMRTGSNLFESHINQTVDILCAGELFNSKFIGFPEQTEAFGVSMETREKDPVTLINALIEQSDKPIPGFRLFSDHDPRVLAHCLQDTSCAKIILSRNVLSSYISLRIAQSTDQWKMMDFHKRKDAKVTFNIDQFKDFSDRRTRHANLIKRSLQVSGQTAFHIDYEDLNTLEVINGVAAFLGSPHRLGNLKEKLKRQNPQPLAEKVINFDEMRQQLSSIDLFAEQKHIPIDAERKPGVPNFVGGQTVPLLYLPIIDSVDPRIADWIAAHDSEGIKTAFNRKELGGWMNGFPNHQTFTVLAHPVERAYLAFENRIFANSKKTMMGLRSMLERNYGLVIPEEDQLTQPNPDVLSASGYPLEAHRKAFVTFLEFLRGNLVGQTRAKIDNAWATQTSLVQGLNSVAHPHHILRPDQLFMGLRQMELSLGLPKQGLAPRVVQQTCFNLSDIYTAEIEAVIRDIYSQDYRLFGFTRWDKTLPN